MPGVPDTSPSMKCAPFWASAATWRSLSGTGCEPSSTTIWPRRAVLRRPRGPCTASSSASLDGRHENTMSAWAPTSAAEPAGTPPIFWNSASDERRKPTTRRPLLIKCSEIGSPILPTPTKPMVSMSVSPAPLCQIDGLIGVIDAQAQHAFHHGPFLQLEGAQAVFEERIAFGNGARFRGVRGAHNGQALARRRPLRIGERAGCEDDAALLQIDHVIEMRGE